MIDPDTPTNYNWIRVNLIENKVNYFPGLTLLYQKSIELFDPYGNLNYFSVTASFVILISTNLVLRTHFSYKIIVMFNVLLLLPIFSVALFIRLGLNTTALMLLFNMSLIIIIIGNYKKKFGNKQSLFYFNIILLAGGLISPNVTLMLIPPFLCVWIFLNVRENSFLQKFVYILSSIFIFILGFYFYYIETINFWTKTIIFNESFSIDSTDSIDSTYYIDSYISVFKSVFSFNDGLRSPSESPLALFSYFLFPMLLIIFIYGSRNKSVELMITSWLSFYFLLATNTGFGEVAFLNGRLAYFLVFNFLLLFSIISIGILEKFLKINSEFGFVNYLGIGLSFFLIFLFPPSPWIPRSEQILFNFKDIYKNLSVKLVHSQFEELTLLDKSLDVKSLNLSNFYNGKVFSSDAIVLNVSYSMPPIWRYLPKEIIPISWYQDITGDKHIKYFNQEILDRKAINDRILKLASSRNFQEFKVVPNNYVILLNNDIVQSMS